MGSLEKQFIEETGQGLRYASWRHHRKIDRKNKKKDAISEQKVGERE